MLHLAGGQFGHSQQYQTRIPGRIECVPFLAS